MLLLFFILFTYSQANIRYFQGTELLSDVNFTQGFSVIPACFSHPEQCATGPQFRLYNPFYIVPPANATWQLAQWDSHSNLSTDGIFVNDGKSIGMQWSTEDKRFILFQDGRIQISVNGFHEYGGKYRDPNTPWVAFLMQQSISIAGGSLALSEVTELRWNLTAQLLYMNQHIQPGYNSSYYAGIFPLYLAIQNLFPSDPDYGKYFWLGIVIYDDRVLMSPLYVNGDEGTGSLIYQPPFSNFANASLHSGSLVHVTGDMMPFVRLGLQAAVERGYLHSTDLRKYYVGGMNIGWEMTGLNNGTIEIGNFSLTQYTAQNPKSYEFNHDGDKEGWKEISATNQIESNPRNGKWIVSSAHRDVHLLNSAVILDTSVVKKIVIKVLSNQNVKVFWSREKEGRFNENDYLAIEAKTGGMWKEYTLDLFRHSTWYGIVHRLRIDPEWKEDSTDFCIDYIRFAPR